MGRDQRLENAPGEPLAHRDGVLPRRGGHPLAGALVASASLQEEAGQARRFLDLRPAMAHEIRRHVRRVAEPGRSRVAAVRQECSDRSAVWSIEADDHDLRVDQALGELPELLCRATVAVDRSAVGKLRAAISGNALDEPTADGDASRRGGVSGLRDRVDDRFLEGRRVLVVMESQSVRPEQLLEVGADVGARCACAKR